MAKEDEELDKEDEEMPGRSPYNKYLEEKELRDKPLKEAPLTEETIMAYVKYIFDLENLEGNYIEDYGKTEKEIKLEKSEWARGTLLSTLKPLPGIDPRTGAYGEDIASLGFLSAGETYLLMGEYDKAIANYTKAIELNPRNIHALFGRGVARYSIGQYREAAYEDLWDAVDLNPIKLAENNEQSRELLERLDEQSQEAFVQVLTECLNARGVAFQKDECYDESMADFSEVLKYDPNYAEAYSNRGGIHLIFHQYEEAVADCSTAISLTPDYANAYNTRGQAYSNLGKYKEAIADFDKKFSLGSGSVNLYIHRSFCYFKLKDYPRALADADIAVQLAPGNAETHYRRAAVYLEMEEYDKAIAGYDEVIRLEGEYANTGDDDDDEGWMEEAQYWRNKAVQKLKA